MKKPKGYAGIGFLSLIVMLLMLHAVQMEHVTLARADSRQQEAKTAWRAIVPAIEVFWKEYQTSPSKLKEDVWPLISMLKNFIKAYPDSVMVPEAYYILAEAYASVSYWPEAEAHWKIVTRYFPNSKWTNQALTSLILYYERTGNKKKLGRFYREIMRRFPDSIAARTAEVLMARQALLAGDLKRARRVAAEVSRSSRLAEVDVPELLDLKARLAIRDGRPRKAIELWLRYLNLTRNPSSRASTLFNIAETYRRMGDFLKARKYYALIRRDFKGQPEYLFARFRMLQLKEQASQRLSKYAGGKVAGPDFYESEQVFKQILERLPRHPINQEVKREFVATELKKKDYLKALLLSERYLREDPDGPYAQDILLMADQARNRMLGMRYGLDRLKEIVSSLKPFLDSEEQGQVYDYMRSVAEDKWAELQKVLLSKGMPREALKQYWDFRQFFRADSGPVKEARQNAVAALVRLDQDFVKDEAFLKLINFHLWNRPKVEELGVPMHYFYLARAYSAIHLGQASYRAYQKAWELGPERDEERCSILMGWTEQVVTDQRFKAAQDTITLLNLYCPERSMGPDALLCKSKLALWQKDYRAAVNMATDSLDMKPRPESVKQAIISAVYLAEWDTAQRVFGKYSRLLDEKDRLDVLRIWGDEALRLGESKEALKVYEILRKLDEDDPSVGFRLNLALSDGKPPAKALGVWKGAAKGEKGVWEEAAKAESSFYDFMKKAGSGI